MRNENVQVNPCRAIESRFVLVSGGLGDKIQSSVLAQLPVHIQLGPEFVCGLVLCLRRGHRQEKCYTGEPYRSCNLAWLTPRSSPGAPPRIEHCACQPTTVRWFPPNRRRLAPCQRFIVFVLLAGQQISP